MSMSEKTNEAGAPFAPEEAAAAQAAAAQADPLKGYMGEARMQAANDAGADVRANAFPDDLVAQVKESAAKVILAAAAAVESFRMPVLAVFVVDNDVNDSGGAAGFSAVNVPLDVADSVVRAGFAALVSEVESAKPH